MGIFDKKRKELPELFREEELADDAGVNYNSVLDWLTGLSDDDYTKVCNIAAIYRKANQDAAAALGIDNEPTSFITVPSQEVVETMNGERYSVDGKNMLDEDDDADIAAILDEPEFLETDDKSKKSKQIEVDEK